MVGGYYYFPQIKYHYVSLTSEKKNYSNIYFVIQCLDKTSLENILRIFSELELHFGQWILKKKKTAIVCETSSESVDSTLDSV